MTTLGPCPRPVSGRCVVYTHSVHWIWAVRCRKGCSWSCVGHTNWFSWTSA